MVDNYLDNFQTLVSDRLYRFLDASSKVSTQSQVRYPEPDRYHAIWMISWHQLQYVVQSSTED